MIRTGLVLLLLTLGTLGLVPQAAQAHAGLILSDPPNGSAFDPAPTEVRLSFTELVEPSLSVVEVTNADGVPRTEGAARTSAGDPLVLVQSLQPLEEGVYTVRWRVISRVDGHASSGRFVFGVGVQPSAVMQLEVGDLDVEFPPVSPLEVASRAILLAGLVVLLGVSAAGAAGSTPIAPRGRAAAMAGGVSAVGLVLLAESQRRAAEVSLGALLSTPIGGALLARAVTITLAGCGLALARFGPRRARRPAMAFTASAVIVATISHVYAGHAAAGDDWLRLGNIVAQWAHVGAAGVWVGGLVALLLTVRGAASGPKAMAVRRFSRMAAPAFAVVVTMGVVRAIGEVETLSDLTATDYGRVVLAKLGVTLVIVLIAAVNRFHSVPVAERTLRPLRIASSGELTAVTLAIIAAAALASLTPPAAIRAAQPPAIVTEGEDFAGTVHVELTVQPGTPGANRFIAHVTDPATGDPLPTDDVTLQFRSLDDFGNDPTTLDLERGDTGAFVGTGTNLQFDATWEVRATVVRAAEHLAVPLELDVPGRHQRVIVFAVPGEPTVYTIELAGEVGLVELLPATERAGTNELRIRTLDVMTDDLPVDHLRLTVTSQTGSRVYPVERVGPAWFTTSIELEPGLNTVSLVGVTDVGIRFRGAIELTVDG